MKIAIDARMYGVENTGIGRYVVNLIDELQAIDTKNKYYILLRSKYYNNLVLSDNFKKVEADYKHYSFYEQIKFKKLIEGLKVDIVHFPHFNFPVMFKGNFIVTLHDLQMHKNKGKNYTTQNLLMYCLKRFGYRFVFDKAVKKSKKIIVPTKYIKEEILREYQIDKEKVVVTYEGVDKKFAKKAKNRSVLRKYKIEDKYFIYVGNAYPHKNLKRAIEAIHYFNQNNKDSHKFVIVTARGVFVERLKILVAKLNAKDDVMILHEISDDELSALYANAEAFLYPTLYEGFGLPGLEAMSIGTLVMASEIFVLREVYQDNAIYFNPYDFSSIEKTIEDVVNMNEKNKSSKIKKAKEFVKNYSWKKMAVETLREYEKAGT